MNIFGSSSSKPKTPHAYSKRLLKESKDFQTLPPEGLKVLDMDSLSEWKIELAGPPSTLYENELFLLRFRFGKDYPLDSPEVVFLKDQKYLIPVHPHIYSNGHICLSILYDNWYGDNSLSRSPALTCQSVCLSLMSMLASCEEKKLPPDNDSYLRVSRKEMSLLLPS